MPPVDRRLARFCAASIAHVPPWTIGLLAPPDRLLDLELELAPLEVDVRPSQRQHLAAT